MPHNSDVLVNYYLNKLAAEHTADTIVCNYSSGSVHMTIFRGTDIVKDYDVVVGKKFQKARKCKFEYWDKFDRHEATFDSLTKAADFFGYSHSSMTNQIKRGGIFPAAKPFICNVRFLCWEDQL